MYVFHPIHDTIFGMLKKVCLFNEYSLVPSWYQQNRDGPKLPWH